jgi:hypothetical protein
MKVRSFLYSGVLVNTGLPFEHNLSIKSLSFPKGDQEHHSDPLLQGKVVTVQGL